MPVATIDPNEWQRYELKSAPPDGFVMLRPLPYGMKLTRRDKAAKMVMLTQTPQRPGRGRMATNSGSDEQRVELETASEWTMLYDFAYCVGDHNLTDTQGAKLDFANPMTIKSLDPRIGSEIETILFELNEEEDTETLEDFLKHPDRSSTDEKKLSLADSGGDHVT